MVAPLLLRASLCLITAELDDEISDFRLLGSNPLFCAFWGPGPQTVTLVTTIAVTYMLAFLTQYLHIHAHWGEAVAQSFYMAQEV
jgi:hypothetical protein